MSSTDAHGPLAGLTVIEVSSVIMAPLAGRLFAKLGADVIKVEPPGGDVLRRAAAPPGHETNGAVLTLNEGKRSVQVDATTDAGREELRRLIAGSDIVLTNLLPHRRRAYGLDWESVRAIDPRVILCTAQGYATDSDRGDLPAYDDTVQAASGVCDVYGKSDGAPRYAPYVLADKMCGVSMVYATLAAVHARHVHGVGQWVDVPMVDVMADFTLAEQLNDFAFDPPGGPAGWHRTVNPTRKPQRSRDGWVCVLPYTDRHWERFCGLAARPDLLRDERTAHHPGRVANTDVVQAAIADWVAGLTTVEVERLCQDAGIPVQRVVPLEELVHDDYLRAQGSIRPADHPREGAYWSTDPGLRFSATPTAPVGPAPTLDEHRTAVLGPDPTPEDRT